MNIDWISITPQSGAAGTSPVSFQLIAENDGFEDKTIKVRAVCGDKEAVKTLVLKGKTYPVGTVFNFDYTGTVQEVTLPPGRYKLQCWGAQGGTSTKLVRNYGSNGGYSEGEITLTQVTTFYVFVGGMGGAGSSTTMVNGGWNGGGGSVGYSTYNRNNEAGYSYPACGGGATDIATVTSDMSYSDYHTNRSNASLLSRCIVAGGGGGATVCRRAVTTTTASDETYNTKMEGTYTKSGNYYEIGQTLPVKVGTIYVLKNVAYMGTPALGFTAEIVITTNGNTKSYAVGVDAKVPTGATAVNVRIRYTSDPTGTNTTWKVCTREYITSTNTTDYRSQGESYGGGISGGGYKPGGQKVGTTLFGYGMNQKNNGLRYVSGAAGGGWNGGETYQSLYSEYLDNIVKAGGGGSGFVNTAANAQYRPDGYTGLQLDSGSTIDGGNYFNSPAGIRVKGHSGNGYARITVIE